MKQTRLGVAALLFATLIVASFHTSSTRQAAPVAVPCSSAALGEAFVGHFHLASMQKFGCEGDWAYSWATVGTGEQAIGVTQVLHFNRSTQRWDFVSRERDCKATILPSVVYRQGCFSN